MAAMFVSVPGSRSDDSLVTLLRDKNDLVVQRVAERLLRERREAGVPLILRALGAPPVSYDDLDEPGQMMPTALSLAQGLHGVDVSTPLLHFRFRHPT